MIEPLFGDALELSEEVEFWVLAGVAPLGIDEALGEVEEEGGGSRTGPGVENRSSTSMPNAPDSFRTDVYKRQLLS